MVCNKSISKVVGPNSQCSRNKSRERLEFSALPTSDLIPGQANDEEKDEEDEADEDAKSLANDSFTTAASTLSLGDICKVRRHGFLFCNSYKLANHKAHCGNNIYCYCCVRQGSLARKANGCGGNKTVQLLKIFPPLMS